MADQKNTRAKADGKVVVSARVTTDDRDWLRQQAAREQRDTGVVLARAIALYRAACEASGFDQDDVAAAMPVVPLAAQPALGAGRPVRDSPQA